jgi:preprotein translocase subunit SecG
VGAYNERFGFGGDASGGRQDESARRHSVFTHLLNIGIILVGLFLGLVILIQRGKGGGLAGAFGGPGGSSAFGSKAGDAFTRFTLITAGVWILLIMVQVRSSSRTSPPARASRPRPASRLPDPRASAMIQSMTGYAEADLERDGRRVRAELRTVNNRHLKLTVRGTDPFPLFENDFEKLVRRKVQRGTVTLHVRTRPAGVGVRLPPQPRRRALVHRAGPSLAREAGWPDGHVAGCWPTC